MFISGVRSFIVNETWWNLNRIFDPSSIRLPVLEHTFCNFKEMPFEFQMGSILPILNGDENYTKGRMLAFMDENL